MEGLNSAADQRILVGEIRAEQVLPILRKFLGGGQAGAHLLEPPSEKLADLRVTLPEFGLHLLPQSMNFVFRQGQDVGADFAGARVGGGKERPEQHARAIGMEHDVGALNSGGFHVEESGEAGWRKVVTTFCASCISASESRKASVDSAPWFWFTRSTCSASRQPPVDGE